MVNIFTIYIIIIPYNNIEKKLIYIYISIFFITHLLQGMWFYDKYIDQMSDGLLYKNEYLISFNSSLIAFIAANLFLLVTIFVSNIFKFKSNNVKIKNNYNNAKRLTKINQSIVYFYSSIVVSIFIATIGLTNLLQNPGFLMEGNPAIFIVLLYVTQYYLSEKIYDRNLNSIDYLLLIILISLYLITSRATLIIFILQILVILIISNYKFKIKDFIFILILLWSIMLAYGYFRHIVTASLFGINLELNLIDFLFSFTDQFDWIMYLNIEGYTGLAGAINEYLFVNLSFDYGNSIIWAFLRIIPSFIYSYFDIDFLSLFHKNNYIGFSVIPGIVESAFLQGGFIGIFLWAVLTGMIMGISLNFINSKHKLFSVIVFVSLLYAIRGGVSGFIILFLTSTIMYILYNKIKN